MRTVVVLLFCCVAHADTTPPTEKPTPMKFEVREGWNRHRRGGADGGHQTSDVSLLVDNGTCEVVDKGEIVSSSLSDDTYVEDKRAWKRTWRGACKFEASGLHATLKAVAGTCKVSRQERRGTQNFKPEENPCEPAGNTLEIACTDAHVGEANMSVWLCTKRSGGNGTGFPWAFSNSRCVRRIGSAPFSYAVCD
jgi:hypothetical protein